MYFSIYYSFLNKYQQCEREKNEGAAGHKEDDASRTKPPAHDSDNTASSPQGPVFWSVLIRRLIKNNVLHNNPQKVPGFTEECLSLGRTRLGPLIVFKKSIPSRQFTSLTSDPAGLLWYRLTLPPLLFLESRWRPLVVSWWL